MSIESGGAIGFPGDLVREPAATPERDNARMIATRLPLFAVLWLGHDAVWATLRVLSGMTEPSVYAAHLAVVALGFGAAILVARREPTAVRVRWVAVGACVLAASAVAVTEARMHGYGEIVRGSHSFLCLLASLLFAWGWAPAAVLVVGSSIAFWMVQAQLQFFLCCSRSRRVRVTTMFAGTRCSPPPCGIPTGP